MFLVAFLVSSADASVKIKKPAVSSTTSDKGVGAEGDGKGKPDFVGRYDNGNGCISGVLSARFERTTTGWTGTYRYTADKPAWGSATYRVEGPQSGNRLTLQQTQILKSDPGINWCTGTIELTGNPATSDRLVGTWTSQDCSCTGQVVLDRTK